MVYEVRKWILFRDFKHVTNSKLAPFICYLACILFLIRIHHRRIFLSIYLLKRKHSNRIFEIRIADILYQHTSENQAFAKTFDHSISDNIALIRYVGFIRDTCSEKADKQTWKQTRLLGQTPIKVCVSLNLTHFSIVQNLFRFQLMSIYFLENHILRLKTRTDSAMIWAFCSSFTGFRSLHYSHFLMNNSIPKGKSGHLIPSNG